MNNKFTPGPWYHDKTIYPIVCPECYSDVDDGTIGEIRKVSDRGGVCSVIDGDEAKANAALIAAAPEMYEALEKAQTFFYSPEPTNESAAEVRAAVDKALKKARGEE